MELTEEELKKAREMAEITIPQLEKYLTRKFTPEEREEQLQFWIRVAKTTKKREEETLSQPRES